MFVFAILCTVVTVASISLIFSVVFLVSKIRQIRHRSIKKDNIESLTRQALMKLDTINKKMALLQYTDKESYSSLESEGKEFINHATHVLGLLQTSLDSTALFMLLCELDSFENKIPN